MSVFSKYQWTITTLFYKVFFFFTVNHCNKIINKIDKAVLNTARIIFFSFYGVLLMNKYNMRKYIEHYSIDTFCLKV